MSAFIYKMSAELSAALAVCYGEYGNGQERVNKLKKDGYDPDKVQALVNKLFPVIKDYIN